MTLPCHPVPKPSVLARLLRRRLRTARQRQQAQRRRIQRRVTAAVRRAVFERDGERCRHCGQPATDLHEIRFRSLGGKRSLENCIALCRWCHEAVQRHRVLIVGHDANGPLRFVER